MVMIEFGIVVILNISGININYKEIIFMSNCNVKQIIIMRNDLNMRKGKMIAQACHAVNKVIFDLDEFYYLKKEIIYNDSYLYKWYNNSFTKICLKIDNLEELLVINKKLNDNNIKTAIITDNGLTEFHGIKTITCLATQPYCVNQLDLITGHLKLL